MTAESLLDQLPKEEQLALLQGQGVKAGTSSLRAVLDTPTGGAKYLNMESQMDFADNESGFQDQEMNAYVPAPPHLPPRPLPSRIRLFLRSKTRPQLGFDTWY